MAHIQLIEFLGTHRLIPAKYASKSVLEDLDLPDSVISDLSELDSATNERMVAERGRNTAIGPSELLYGVPRAQIVNAAFTHPGPSGARFNSSRRGAWYAGVELKTSLSEVVHHKRQFLKDARIEGKNSFEYADFLADFSGEFHSLDGEELASCLAPGPIPQCYSAPQLLAESLLNQGSNGVVYPSVRYPSGTCIACFRPALIFHPRRGSGYRLSIEANVLRFNSEEFTLDS